MSLDWGESIEELDDFSKFEILTIIIITIVMILAVFCLPVLKTMSERQKCQDYSELIGVEYAYKKNLGCFIKNKKNEWQFVNLEKLEE